MLNSTVTKLTFNVSGGRKVINGVEFVYNGRQNRVRVLREAILSAGAVNSPQILLLSGIGPRAELDRVNIPQVHELPGVGRNLHNHVTFYMSYLLHKRENINDLDWANVLEYILNRRGPMSSTGLSQVTARVNSKYADPSGTHPDLQVFFAGYLAKCASTGAIKALADEEHPESPRSIYMSPVVLHPKSRGHISLKSNNPLDPPLMYANYLTEPEDLATLLEGVRVCQRLANTTVLREKYGIQLDREDYGDCAKQYPYDSDEFWECALKHATGPENHQAGSCKMGPASDSMAVVDPKLEVYGITGLRVMDASVMPSLVSGNTHATVVMIAEKGTDYIKEKWNGQFLGSRFGEGNRKPVEPSRPLPPLQSRPVSENTIATSCCTTARPGPFPQNTKYPRYPPPPRHPPSQQQYHHFQHNVEFHQRHPELPNPFDNRGSNQASYYEFPYGDSNEGSEEQ